MKSNYEEKVLNISNPPITTFFHIDIPLCIIYDDVETHPWIFSNYIQLYSIHNISKTNPCFIDFHHSINGAFRFLELSTCPWILFERISRKDIVNKWFSVLDFVKEKISENKYIGITVDTQKIKNYGKIGAMHNLFIYGYSDKKNILYSADHFVHGMFKFEEVSYNEFADSVLYSYEDDLNWGNLEGVCIFSKIKRQHKNIHKLDIRKVIHDLKSYLLLEGFAYKNDEYYVYGIECYDSLINYYLLLLQFELPCDVKGIYTEICHKTMMVLRLEYFKKNGYDVEVFIDKFKTIQNKLTITLNIILKYGITGKKGSLEKAINNLKEIKIEEANVINELIEKLVGSLV